MSETPVSEPTPGPWRIAEDGWDEDGLVILGGPPNTMREHGVAVVVNFGQGVEMCEADAHLIAAAPALLAAAGLGELALSFFDDSCGDAPDVSERCGECVGCLVEAANTALRAAIDAATEKETSG